MILNKYLSIYFILINLFTYCDCYYDICIVGASSGLGKELVYQSLNNRKLKVLALTSNLDGIKEPYRGGGLNDNYEKPIVINKNLKIENYWKDINYAYEYKNIIFTTGSSPFKEDYSYFLTNKYLNKLSVDCKTLSLVSAYGAGDSLNDANLGIKVMENFYLRKVYQAKNKQEDLINNYKQNISSIKNPYYLNKVLIQNKNLKKNIYRPKVLTYGENIFNGQTRENLAMEILDNMIF
tara:strand:- start:15 stop:725 length:711 start_codon:yes stop_codon:yes gene_type:complete